MKALPVRHVGIQNPQLNGGGYAHFSAGSLRLIYTDVYGCSENAASALPSMQAFHTSVFAYSNLSRNGANRRSG